MINTFNKSKKFTFILTKNIMIIFYIVTIDIFNFIAIKIKLMYKVYDGIEQKFLSYIYRVNVKLFILI